MSARLIAAVLLAAALDAAATTAQVRPVDLSIDLQGPRPFGYLIGDVIRLEADIVVDEGFALLPGSLPKPRSVNYWLDLKSMAVQDHGVRGGRQRYSLILDYQTFYAPLAPIQLEIPGFVLSVSDGTTRVEGQVPGWRFLMSPLREITPSPGEPGVILRSDAEPPPIPLAMPRAAALASGIATLILLGMLARHRVWWPFRARRRRPFARAARSVRQAVTRAPHTTEGYVDGLLSLHRAFDATAGRRVLADDVPAFITRMSAFRPLQADIDRLFQASRRAFFAADPVGAMTTVPPDALVLLARRLAAAERAVS